MKSKMRWLASFSALLIICSFLVNGLPAHAQDLPPVEDLSLGSSVFLFRSSGKTRQKKSVPAAGSKAKRTNSQRIAYTKKIRNQYEGLARVTERRKRIKPVTEENLAQISRKTPKEAAVILTGAGQYYYDKNETNKSIGYFREAVTLDRTNADAKLGLSDSLARRGAELLETNQNQEAKTFYEEAIKYNDKNSVAYVGLGELYDTLEENDRTIADAVKNYEKALAIDKDLTEIYAPLGILYFEQNQIAKADDLLTKALLTSKDNATTYYFLGLVRYTQARYPDALAAFGQAVKIDPTLAEARNYSGEIYEKLDREAEAVAEYKEAVRLNPKYVEAWFNLGAAYFNQGNYQEAIPAYKEVVRLQNTNGEAHANLGDAYRLLNRFGEAEGSYRLAALFIKNDSEIFSKLGYVLGRQLKWNGAVEALNKAVALSPDAIDYTNLGWAYYNAAQIDLKTRGKETEAKPKLQQAKAALQKATAGNQNFAPTYLNLGITLTDLGEYQAAVEALKRATELRKNWIFAINELGIAYRKLNDFENAVRQFQQAVAIDDKFAIGYFNLGEAELRRGNTKEARKALDKLKKLNRNMANALEIMFLGAGKK